MERLKKKILEEGNFSGKDIVKVDSFLNHQIDIAFLNEIGKEFKKRFADETITKIVTIEASGIAIAAITAQYFDFVPVVFAKKTQSRNLDDDVYYSSVYSFTKLVNCPILVSKKYIQPNDRILIIDDFLANGKSVLALADIIEQAGAYLVGAGVVIEKEFQFGSKRLKERGIRLEALAVIKKIHKNQIVFEEE